MRDLKCVEDRDSVPELHGGTEENHMNISHDIECRTGGICARLLYILDMIIKLIPF
jgi:hypothetical protein